MSDTSNRLTKATARAERALQRNRAQAAMLRKAARTMADRATQFLETRSRDGHDDAAAATAARGRYLARTLAGEDQA